MKIFLRHDCLQELILNDSSPRLAIFWRLISFWWSWLFASEGQHYSTPGLRFPFIYTTRCEWAHLWYSSAASGFLRDITRVCSAVLLNSPCYSSSEARWLRKKLWFWFATYANPYPTLISSAISDDVYRLLLFTIWGWWCLPKLSLTYSRGSIFRWLAEKFLHFS